MSIPYSELTQAGLDAERFHVSDRKSLRGPCPQCGGTRRFVLFIDKQFPNWNGFCDVCGWKGWLREINPNLKSTDYTPPPVKKYEKRNKLNEWRETKIWDTFHAGLTREDQDWWESQGIPIEWQNYWKLGVCEDKSFKYDGKQYMSLAYTIPKFGLNWTPMNMDYRLLEFPEGAGKYRPEYGLPIFPFLSDPDDEEFFYKEVLIVEGSKKAMVTFLRQTRITSIIGVPSCNSWAGAENLVGNAEAVYIAFDPDADLWASRLAEKVDGRAITLASKIDDAFLDYGLTNDAFHDLVRWARVP